MFICIAHTIQFGFEFSAIALELFGEFLGHGKRFESIISLSFSPVKPFLEMSCVDLLLVDKNCKTMGFAFVLLDLGFEFLCFLGKLRGKCLEFLKLEVN